MGRCSAPQAGEPYPDGRIGDLGRAAGETPDDPWGEHPMAATGDFPVERADETHPQGRRQRCGGTTNRFAGLKSNGGATLKSSPTCVGDDNSYAVLGREPEWSTA